MQTFRDRLRHRLDAVILRVRGALDLPSRAELLEVNHRLDELDRRIAIALAAAEPASEPAGASDAKKNGKKGAAQTRKK